MRPTRPALRTGFSCETPKIISRTNSFLAGSLNGGRRVDGVTIDAKEKNVCRFKERPKSKQEACRNRLCSRLAENRSEPDPSSDSQAGYKPTDGCCQPIACKKRVDVF